jgi:hypothetical protein
LGLPTMAINAVLFSVIGLPLFSGKSQLILAVFVI